MKRALVGFHSPRNLETFEVILGFYGYRSDLASDFDHMFDFTKSQKYDLYLMDTNLGNSRKAIIEPSREILDYLTQNFEPGTYKFLTLTAWPECYDMAKKADIPVEKKGKLDLSVLLEEKAVGNF